MTYRTCYKRNRSHRIPVVVCEHKAETIRACRKCLDQWRRDEAISIYLMGGRYEQKEAL